MSLNGTMIAPCGMNCALCLGHQRAKKTCAGCRGEIADIHSHCQKCVIRSCDKLQDGFCYACDRFPCKRLKQLDARYRKNYGMSMIQNLQDIAQMGLAEFVKQEEAKWACPNCGQLLCVHRNQCQHCGGGTGIRTPGTGVTRSTVFKTAAFNRSAIPPRL